MLFLLALLLAVLFSFVCRKTLKKLMIDRKIPLDRRSLLPVAADAHGILGVYGIGVNLDRAAAPGDRAVIIRIEELEKEDSLYD